MRKAISSPCFQEALTHVVIPSVTSLAPPTSPHLVHKHPPSHWKSTEAVESAEAKPKRNKVSTMFVAHYATPTRIPAAKPFGVEEGHFFPRGGIARRWVCLRESWKYM